MTTHSRDSRLFSFTPCGRSLILPLLIILLGTIYGCGSNKKVTTSATHSSSTHEAMRNLDCRLIDAKLQQELGNTDVAMQMYRSLINDAATYAAPYYELGGLYKSRHYNDSALLLTRKAIALDKDNVWYRLQETEILEDMKDYTTLAAAWEKIVEKNPNVIDYYYELSNAYLLCDDGERAIEVLDRVEKRYGVSETISLHQKEIWEAMNRPDMAMKEVEQLAKAMPNETKYSAIMAEICMKKKDFRGAKQYYDQILKNDPNDEYIHLSLANYYKITGQPSMALDELKNGLRHPNLECQERLNVLTSFYSGELTKSNKLPDDCIELARQIAEHCPDDAEVLSFYGTLLMYDTQYVEAAKILELSIGKDSSDYRVWEMLLICLDASSQDKSKVTSIARRAAKLYPLHTLPIYLLGVDALVNHDYKEASKQLKRCEMMGFRHGYLERETYSMLGDCHYWLGEYDKAWRYYDKSLAIDSTDIYTLNNYAYFLSEQGVHLEKALRMSQRTITEQPNNATYLDTYAWILHKLGRDAEALPIMQKAIQLSSDDKKTIHNHLEIIKAGISQ